MPKCPNCKHTLERTVVTKVGRGSVMTYRHTENCSGCAADWARALSSGRNVTYYDMKRFKK